MLRCGPIEPRDFGERHSLRRSVLMPATRSRSDKARSPRERQDVVLADDCHGLVARSHSGLPPYGGASAAFVERYHYREPCLGHWRTPRRLSNRSHECASFLPTSTAASFLAVAIPRLSPPRQTYPLQQSSARASQDDWRTESGIKGRPSGWMSRDG